MNWILTTTELPQCKHCTSDGNFSDPCICVNCSGELFILSLCELPYDDELGGPNHYWGAENGSYDEDVDGVIVAWCPIPNVEPVLKAIE